MHWKGAAAVHAAFQTAVETNPQLGDNLGLQADPLFDEDMW